MIVILGYKEEEHAKHIAKHLEDIKEEYCFLDTAQYPYDVLFSWNADCENSGSIVTDNKKIYFSDIKSVYWRNFSGIKNEIIEDGDNTDFLSDMVYRERESALYSLFYSLKINWVNSINAFELHKKKPYLTNLFKKNNIRVPRTLITNDKDSVLDFFESNNEQIILKPVRGGAYTQKMTKDDFTKDKLSKLIVSPVQFQEYIDGTDIRVYAYQNEIYALEIQTDNIDFRTDENARLIPIELPEQVKQDCLKVMKICDLKYSGIDIRLNSKNEYVFIEANPAPMFINVEKKTGYPLTQALINLLVNC